MHKTLHKKLTAKHPYDHMPSLVCDNGEHVLPGLYREMAILREAAKDLMEPRPQAIANILKMAREI